MKNLKTAYEAPNPQKYRIELEREHSERNRLKILIDLVVQMFLMEFEGQEEAAKWLFDHGARTSNVFAKIVDRVLRKHSRFVYDDGKYIHFEEPVNWKVNGNDLFDFFYRRGHAELDKIFSKKDELIPKESSLKGQLIRLGKMKNLKQQLIRLGHTNPNLRRHLTLILDSISKTAELSSHLQGKIKEYASVGLIEAWGDGSLHSITTSFDGGKIEIAAYPEEEIYGDSRRDLDHYRHGGEEIGHYINNLLTQKYEWDSNKSTMRSSGPWVYVFVPKKVGHLV